MVGRKINKPASAGLFIFFSLKSFTDDVADDLKNSLYLRNLLAK